MSSNFVFCFLFLFSNLPLLLSAAPECENEKTSCGSLGEISFPFTTVHDSECGLYIDGCDSNSSVKTINLKNQTYKIDSISYMNNSVIIYGVDSSELEPIKNTPNFSINTINFYVCNHSHSHDNKFKYRTCSDYDIYFTSTPDYPPMFPIFPLSCFPVPFETFNCVDIISLLQIKVDLESCEGCYLEGKSCLLNQETLNFSCGPVLKHPIPKRNDRHLKNAVKEEEASCGYLGEISFPFTTVDKSECGLYIVGCDSNSSVKTINLINQTYEIDSISYMNNSVIIYGLNSSELEPIKNTPNFSINTINFYVCNHGYDNSHDNKFKYRTCSDYDIYFTSTPDYPPMFPTFPLACFPVPVETFNCVEISSLLEIKVDLESCGGCYPEGKSCQLNQETLNFSCGPALTPQIPKRNDRHLKNAVKGKLGDGREVAVKRLFERNYRPVESFTNEIQILTRMRHRNLVSLYGCTSRHSRELLLVYEYIPNGTVSSHLHDNKAGQSSSLPWSVRMKIAIETASALTQKTWGYLSKRFFKNVSFLLQFLPSKPTFLGGNLLACIFDKGY